LRTVSALETRLWLVALVCVAAMLLLGALVAFRPPTRIDVEAVALRGEAVPLALFFTGLGRWPVLLGVSAAALAAAWWLRSGLWAVGILYAAQVVSQGANALIKLGFHRARPDAWLHIKEPDLSFPSGHAVTAMVLFFGLAILTWHSPLPRPAAAAICALLLACTIGIPWSRLALGAHYFTDVIGGLLLGTAFLCVALATILRFAPASAG
jgi:undecaprenyl-diphosphatase